MAVLSCGCAQGEHRCAVMLDAVLKQKQQGKEKALQGSKDGRMFSPVASQLPLKDTSTNPSSQKTHEQANKPTLYKVTVN